MSRKSRQRTKPAFEPEINAVKLLTVKPKTQGQAKYFDTLKTSDITVVIGCAGTGKSYLALGLACQYLLEGKIDKIVIARPTVEASPRGLGYLKGSLEEKLSPYVYPAVEHMKQFLGRDRYSREYHNENIKFEALEYMRGRTYDNSFMILEEAQNCTLEQLKMFITRIGENSKILINGDTDQKDIKSHDLEHLYGTLRNAKSKSFGTVELGRSDIVRNPIIEEFLELFDE